MSNQQPKSTIETAHTACDNALMAAKSAYNAAVSTAKTMKEVFAAESALRLEVATAYMNRSASMLDAYPV